MDWFFNGLGTLFIGILLGGAGGGFVGYRIGINKNITNQNQKARDNSQQIQVRDGYVKNQQK